MYTELAQKVRESLICRLSPCRAGGQMYRFKNSHCHENWQRDCRHPAGIWRFRQYPFSAQLSLTTSLKPMLRSERSGPGLAFLWMFWYSQRGLYLICNTVLVLFTLLLSFLTRCLRYGPGRRDRIVSTRLILSLWAPRLCHSANVSVSVKSHQKGEE